jgi:hypothetical protein
MTSEELAAAGVLPTEGNAPSSRNDPIAKTIRDSNSREDGEIGSENRSGGDEDLSNIEVDLSELVAAKVKSYPPAFVFGNSKVTTETIKEHEKAGFFPTGDGHAPSNEEVPALKPTKLLFSGTFSPVGIDFLATLIYLPFWRCFP